MVELALSILAAWGRPPCVVQGGDIPSCVSLNFCKQLNFSISFRYSFFVQEGGDGAVVAVTTTGVGEELLQTQLASAVSKSMHSCAAAPLDMVPALEHLILRAEQLPDYARRESGLIALRAQRDSEQGMRIDFVFAHSTPSLGLGYLASTESSPTVLMSRMAADKSSGTSVLVEGRHIHLA